MKQTQTHKIEREKIFTIQKDGSLRENIDAISVFDYLHTDENDGDYRMNTQEFGDVVSNVLRKQTFNIAIKRVLTANDNTSLRMKNVNHEMSPEFKNLTNSKPVVMAGGLFSDLTMWEDGGDGLAFDLARSGKDVWEIEITGGPGEECDSCADYTYEDLVDSYWPALVGAVQYYSGDVTLDYVGHSNGCRVALSSLGKYQESGLGNVGFVDGVGVDLEGGSEADVVGTFVGVACPGELNGGSFLSEITRFQPIIYGPMVGDYIMEDIETKHLEMGNYARAAFTVELIDDVTVIGVPISFLAGIFTDDKISKNLMTYYNDLSMDGDSDFNLNGLEIDKVRLYCGNMLFLGHDGVVPVGDMDVIFDEVDSEDENTLEDGAYVGFPFNVDHVFIKSKGEIKNKILEDLK